MCVFCAKCCAFPSTFLNYITTLIFGKFFKIHLHVIKCCTFSFFIIFYFFKNIFFICCAWCLATQKTAHPLRVQLERHLFLLLAKITFGFIQVFFSAGKIIYNLRTNNFHSFLTFAVLKRVLLL
jgi:hypothetical protein